MSNTYTGTNKQQTYFKSHNLDSKDQPSDPGTYTIDSPKDTMIWNSVYKDSKIGVFKYVVGQLIQMDQTNFVITKINHNSGEITLQSINEKPSLSSLEEALKRMKSVFQLKLLFQDGNAIHPFSLKELAMILTRYNELMESPSKEHSIFLSEVFEQYKKEFITAGLFTQKQLETIMPNPHNRNRLAMLEDD